MTLVAESRGRKAPQKARAAAKEKAPAGLTPRKFAAALGVSRAAVRRALDDGRLVESVEKTERGGRVYCRIDLEAGRAEWARNTAPRKDTGTRTVSLEPEDLDAGPGASAAAERRLGEPINFAEERARKERALADRHELVAAQLRGELVNREQVERAMADLGRRVREKLASFAAELPDELHMRRSKDVAIVLERATAEVATELADELERLAGADGRASA